jgi:hypothetical protein
VSPLEAQNDAENKAQRRVPLNIELDVILLDGIGGTGKEGLAHERLRVLHPLPQGKDRYPKDLRSG